MVLFGVTGDLSRKKVMPAIYDLANRGLLPPGLQPGRLRPPRLGRRGLRAGRARRGQGARAHRVPRGGVEAARRGLPLRPGQLRRRHGVQHAAPHHRGARRGPRHRRQPRLLPRDPAGLLRRRRRPAQGARARAAGARLVAAGRGGEAVRARPGVGARAQRDPGRRVPVSGSIFRIDHYLGKETVQNILAMRFANEMFEPIWNSNYVDHVQITMAEDIGIGGRAGYYDGIGAARDVIQNHLHAADVAGGDGGARRPSTPRACAWRSSSCSPPCISPAGST